MLQAPNMLLYKQLVFTDIYKTENFNSQSKNQHWIENVIYRSYYLLIKIFRSVNRALDVESDWRKIRKLEKD